MRKLAFPVLVLALALSLAACGGDEATNTPTATLTASPTASVTPSASASPTGTATTVTASPTATTTASATATATSTSTATATATASATGTPSATATPTASATQTATASGTPTTSPAGNYLDPPSADVIAQFPADVQPLLKDQPGIVVNLLLELRKQGAGDIVVEDSGGEEHDALFKSSFDAWEKVTGWTITSVPGTDPLPLIEAQINAGNPEWDYFELASYGNAIRFEQKGYLEKIDLKYFPVDYYPKTARITDYTVDTVPYGTVLEYNTDVFGDNPPTSALDIYDTQKFPGKRCVYDYPYWNMEWALMADGVPFSQVYDVLGTPEGQKRAFDKLSSIKDDIVFWSSGAESVQFLLDGQCDIGQTWNGRPGARVKEDSSLPLAIVWKDAFIDGSPNAIPKGAKNYKAALSLYAWQNTPKNQCNLINEIAYGNVMNAAPFPDCLTDFGKVWGPQPDKIAGTPSSDFWADHEGDLADAWTAWKTGG